MKKSRYGAEQNIGFLKHADAVLRTPARCWVDAAAFGPAHCAIALHGSGLEPFRNISIAIGRAREQYSMGAMLGGEK